MEQYPIRPEDLNRILTNFPELKVESLELCAQYYLPLPAYHRLNFNDNVSLTIVIGNIQHKLSELKTPVDTWFINKFSLTINDTMWGQKAYLELARLSHKDTTFVTSIINSQISKGLENVGFKVYQDKGFADTSEILYGKYSKEKNYQIKQCKPWFQHKSTNFKDKNIQIAILGAGISGAATAFSLALRGYHVNVYEQHATSAAEASGNYQGILYGSWSAFGGEMMELSSAGYRYSHTLIKQLLEDNKDYSACGLVQLAHNQAQAKRNQQLATANLPDDFCYTLTPQHVEKLAQQKIGSNLDGLFFPYGLWLKPKKLVAALLNHPNINLITNCQINQLNYQEQQWQLIDNHGQLISVADSLVLANAYNINNFSQTKQLPIRKIRGQISIANAKQSVATILCGKAYLTPVSQDKFTFGASFKFNDESLEIRQEEHLENLLNLKEISAQLYADVKFNQLDGQVNYRASTYDYFPLVGPVADYEIFKKTFAKLRQDANARFNHIECYNYPNLYLNIGHGAKGILTAPICGEIIADYIDNTPLPCSENLRTALHPNRLYVKELIKNGNMS